MVSMVSGLQVQPTPPGCTLQCYFYYWILNTERTTATSKINSDLGKKKLINSKWLWCWCDSWCYSVTFADWHSEWTTTFWKFNTFLSPCGKVGGRHLFTLFLTSPSVQVFMDIPTVFTASFLLTKPNPRYIHAVDWARLLMSGITDPTE